MELNFFDAVRDIISNNYPCWQVWYGQGEGFPYCMDWYARHRDGRLEVADTAEDLVARLARQEAA